MPSTSLDTKRYWDTYIDKNLDFSDITIGTQSFDFSKPQDCFKLTENIANKLALIGKEYSFLSFPVSLRTFEFQIFDNFSLNTNIGTLLNSITHKSAKSIPYAILGTYIYHKRSVYCSFTVGIVDGDTGIEMETAVVEISQDETDYIQPVYINIEALDYFTYDDIAKISYWLGDFWIGIQYEMINRPEEIRVIEQRSVETNNGNHPSNSKNIVWVKTIISIDSDGNTIKYNSAHSGRKYSLPSWGVRGHIRTLSDGREIFINPYRKGKKRNDPNSFVNKEYRFVDEKIDNDSTE